MEYERIYADTNNYFGKDPDPILERFAHRLDPGRAVLDIGAGQGRNSLFLAKKRIHVDAIDPVDEGLKTLQALANKEGLPIQTYINGFETFTPSREPYGGLLLFGLLQHVRPNELNVLREKVGEWTVEGSILFVTCFATGDESFRYYRDNWNEIGKNTFESQDKDVRFFVEPNEVLTLFPGFKALHHWEGFGPKHKHQDNGPEHCHARVEAVLVRGK